MSSTYSDSLRVELVGPGDQAGAWGTTTNNNFNYIFDKAIAGYLDVDITASPHTLTSVSGPTSSSNLNQSIYASLRFINAVAASTVYAPAVPKTYVIWNNSGYAVTLYNTGYSTGPTIANGAKVLVFSNGVAFYEVSPQTINGVATVAKGGTGVTTSTGSGSVVLSTSPTLTTPTLTTPSLTGTISLGATWSVLESAGVLYFKSSGTSVASLDSSGNFTVIGDVTSYGTI
jgi:uncharacterized membrane protein